MLASGREPDYSQNEYELTFKIFIEQRFTYAAFVFSIYSEFNYTQWESKEIFEKRFLEKLDDEQV